MKIGDTVMSQDGDIWEVLDVPRSEEDWPGAGSSGFYHHRRTGGQQYGSNIPGPLTLITHLGPDGAFLSLMDRSPLGGADRYAHGAGDGYREFYYWPHEVVRIAGEGME